MLPFTTSQFFAVFAAYNAAIWPAQIAASALGLACVALLFVRPQWADRTIAALLAAMWLFMGVGYHLMFFAAINPAAYGFAALFVVAALVFVVEGLVRNRIRFAFSGDVGSATAGLLIAYGLVAYPLLGLLGAHPYPETPLFGVAPCPTTIFTLGFLMLARSNRPVLVAAIPFLWSGIGGSAAIVLDVPQDWGLLAAGAAWLGVHLSRSIATRRAPRPV